MQAQIPKVLKLEDPTLLPMACFASMYMGTRVFYKGTMLNSYIDKSLGSQMLKAIEVGDYLYVAQNLWGTDKWSTLARAGHKILWIINKPTKKVVGKVVDGKVTRL